MSRIGKLVAPAPGFVALGTPIHSSTRRQLINGGMVALGALSLDCMSRAQEPQQNMKEAQSTAANSARTFLHQEITFKASPQRIYGILLDSKQFAVVTGMPAEIDPNAGGAFTTFGGLVVGRNVELLPNQRIVQAWRPTHWDPGVYSVVRFDLKVQGPETLVVLDHTGFPEGEFDHLNTGWPLRYWDPLKKYIAAA
jgi:activator of HSP90 ATPase